MSVNEPTAEARQRARRALASCAAVILVLTAIVIFLVWNGAGHSPTQPGNPPLQGTPEQLHDHGEVDPDGDEDMTWIDVAGVSLPVSQELGPEQIDLEHASGFAPCAHGAALAAMHIMVRSMPEMGPDIFGPTIAHQITGNFRTVYATAVSEAYDHLMEESPDSVVSESGDFTAQISGFIIDHDGDDVVSLRLLNGAVDEAGDEVFASLIVSMEWVDDDWNLIAPEDGTWKGALTPVPSAEGFHSLHDLEACDA